MLHFCYVLSMLEHCGSFIRMLILRVDPPLRISWDWERCRSEECSAGTCVWLATYVSISVYLHLSVNPVSTLSRSSQLHSTVHTILQLLYLELGLPKLLSFYLLVISEISQWWFIQRILIYIGGGTRSWLTGSTCQYNGSSFLGQNGWLLCFIFSRSTVLLWRKYKEFVSFCSWTGREAQKETLIIHCSILSELKSPISLRGVWRIGRDVRSATTRKLSVQGKAGYMSLDCYRGK